jgi:hypothetical protein
MAKYTDQYGLAAKTFTEISSFRENE